MNTALHRARRFSKMHGAGNDFIVLDLRDGSAAPSPDEAARMADRHFGIGCDQILTIESPLHADTVASYRIWNADGSVAGQCGNGARCVAAWLMRDGTGRGAHFAIDSPAGTISAEPLPNGDVRLAMTVPQFSPVAIPLKGMPEASHYRVDSPFGALSFGAVSMGNPHAVLEVANIDAADVDGIGSWLQRSAWFPESVNVGFAQVLAPDHIRLRVFERGVGETLACGSGACAAVAVLVRQARVQRAVRVDLPGGTLTIAWPDDAAAVVMAGPTVFVFEGEWTHD